VKGAKKIEEGKLKVSILETIRLKRVEGTVKKGWRGEKPPIWETIEILVIPPRSQGPHEISKAKGVGGGGEFT